jgi:hypothetical protein
VTVDEISVVVTLFILFMLSDIVTFVDVGVVVAKVFTVVFKFNVVIIVVAVPLVIDNVDVESEVVVACGRYFFGGNTYRPTATLYRYIMVTLLNHNIQKEML